MVRVWEGMELCGECVDGWQGLSRCMLKGSCECVCDKRVCHGRESRERVCRKRLQGTVTFETVSQERVDRKNPPPPQGGFLFTMFLGQEHGVRGPPSKHLYQLLRGGSSSSGFLIREHSK